MTDLYTDNDKTLMKELKTQINGKCKDFKYVIIKILSRLLSYLSCSLRNQDIMS